MANVAQSIVDRAILESLRDETPVTVDSEDDCSRDDLVCVVESAADGYADGCYYGFGATGHRWQIRVAS